MYKTIVQSILLMVAIRTVSVSWKWTYAFVLELQSVSHCCGDLKVTYLSPTGAQVSVLSASCTEQILMAAP